MFVLLTRLAWPETSEAVGSVYDTWTLGVPSSTVWTMLLVHTTEGGVVSTGYQRKKVMSTWFFSFRQSNASSDNTASAFDNCKTRNFRKNKMFANFATGTDSVQARVSNYHHGAINAGARVAQPDHEKEKLRLRERS